MANEQYNPEDYLYKSSNTSGSEENFRADVQALYDFLGDSGYAKSFIDSLIKASKANGPGYNDQLNYFRSYEPDKTNAYTRRWMEYIGDPMSLGNMTGSMMSQSGDDRAYSSLSGGSDMMGIGGNYYDLL